MPPPGIRISGLRGCLSDEALLERRLDLALDGGVLRATEAGLRRLIPPGGRLSLEQISAASIRLRVSSTLVSAAAEIRPLVGENGFLGMEILSARAAGIPVPIGLVAAALREAMPQQPWLHARGGTRWDVDVAAVLQPLGLGLPPLSAVRLEDGALELEFASAVPAVAMDDGRQTEDEGRRTEAGGVLEEAVPTGAAAPVGSPGAAQAAPAERRVWRPEQI